MKRHAEALWWSLFSVGGVLTALCVPGLILATSYLLPTIETTDAAERYAQVLGVVQLWPVRLALMGVIALGTFHCAHRFRHILLDLGLRRHDQTLVALCYSTATAFSLVAAFLLITRF